MRKFVLLMAALVFGATGIQAATVGSKTTMMAFRYGNSFIFMENGITFSVYPEGEFDFYIDQRVNIGVGARLGNVGITFNSGFNYNPFVQYDDFGAVVQVENVPIFYDYYGRVSQIGGVDIWYRNGFVNRLGGLNVFWNGGSFSHTTGFINIHNRRYVSRPWHRWFVRPAVGFCNVWATPYRRWYTPIRYSWHRPYRNNVRRAYAQIGREHRFSRDPRASIYRNDRRVAVQTNHRVQRNHHGRNNRAIAERRSVARSNKTVAQRNNRSMTSRNNYGRQGQVSRSTSRTRTTDLGRSNKRTLTTQRSITRGPRNRTVTKREVVRTPNNRAVSKRSTAHMGSNRGIAQNSRSRSTGVKRSVPAKRSVTRSTTTRRSTSGTINRGSRSTGTRSTRR